MDKIAKTFIIYITTLSRTLMMQIHSFCQICIGLLLTYKALIEVLPEYLDYVNIFLFNLIIELRENISINKYAIKLVEDNQSYYRLICSLR